MRSWVVAIQSRPAKTASWSGREVDNADRDRDTACPIRSEGPAIGARMDNQPPEWARRLRNERLARGWGKREMARQLYNAAGIQGGNVTSLAKQVGWHETGDHFPTEWGRHYASVFETSERALFGGRGPGQALALVPLLAAPKAGSGPIQLPVVERVEGLLRRLYRLEAEFGGDELCGVVADQVETALGVIASSVLDQRSERRLYVALAGLTQIAGWLAIDAARPGDANRYLSAAVYAAHEIGDLALAAHAMGYMSLHALYGREPRKSLTLASTASTLAEATSSPRTRAILHQRAARAHAGLGESDACRRRLDQAEAEYTAGTIDPEPQWTAYVTEVEIAAQRGACLLDLEMPEDAIDALKRAIALLETAAPDHHRDLAHYKTRLASAHLLQGEPEQAAHVAGEAHEVVMQVGSARVAERLRELVIDLEEFDIPQTRDLAERVRAR